MVFENRTKIDLDALLKFKKNSMSFWRPLFITVYSLLGATMAIATTLITILTVKMSKPVDRSLIMVSAFIIIFCALRIFAYARLSTKMMREQAQIEATLIAGFTEDRIELHSESGTSVSNTDFSYDAIKKVSESESAYYLYTLRNSGFILSKQGFTEGELADFIPFIRTKIDSKKIKIK